MKKIITLILLSAILTSCGITNEEKLNILKSCDDAGYGTYQPLFGDLECSIWKNKDPVIKCIEEYTNGLDEKYNNPDTVSNLREDNYSQVVKTCNEIFGDK